MKNNVPIPPQANSTEAKKIKTCFVVMPISDMEPYPIGHFHRVFDHLISPACKEAGYEVIRADKVASSNLIILNIIKNILDADLVICDISGKNPNVLYELGVRHSFDLPTVLIKDSQTTNIFDIQGLRYTQYDENLRIDNIQRNIKSIVDSIKETTAPSSSDVNSFVRLLNISAAKKPDPKEIPQDTLLILDYLGKIEKRLNSLELNRMTPRNYPSKEVKDLVTEKGTFSVGDEIWLDGSDAGIIKSITNHYITLQHNRKEKILKIEDFVDSNYSTLPF